MVFYLKTNSVLAYQFKEGFLSAIDKWPKWLRSAYDKEPTEINSIFFSDNNRLYLNRKETIIEIPFSYYIINHETDDLLRIANPDYFEKNYTIDKPELISHNDKT